jgi:hypothetical protein
VVHKKTIVVSDEHLVDIVEALTQLIDPLKVKAQNGMLKLNLAVQIGNKLGPDQQRQFIEIGQDTYVPDKFMSKVVHALSLHLPMWAIHDILRIYLQADRVKTALIMFNDLMDEYEDIMYQFEYEFLEGQLPSEENELETALQQIKSQLQKLSEQVRTKERDYNSSYGDSSFASNEFARQGDGGKSFCELIGLPADATSEEITRQSKSLLKKLHPDQGGSAYLFHLIKQAYDEYRQT